MNVFFYVLGLMTGISLSAFFHFYMMVKFKSFDKRIKVRERLAVSNYGRSFRYSGKGG
jgi:uncharacterized membrane protein YciS (DUF1049 family)